jgi:predicted phosphodiesterase
MFAVLSDVHANREALAAVMEEVLRLNPERIICLGDIVGYGPDPEWCVDAVRSSCEIVLCGNHDAAVVFGARDFSDAAERTVNYHRQLLMPGDDDDRDVPQARWSFLKGLPQRHAENGMLFVHGAPRNPINEYLRERDVQMKLERKFKENFDLVERLAFVGHTHHPGVITPELRFLKPDDFADVYHAEPARKAIINVGSVGQPRDRDPRAVFVTVDGDEIRYHRVQYNVEKTAAKIEQCGAIDPSIADRLREGT